MYTWNYSLLAFIFAQLNILYTYGVILCVKYRSDVICSADVINWLQALLVLWWLATVIWGQLPHFTVEQTRTLCATKHHKVHVIFRVISVKQHKTVCSGCGIWTQHNQYNLYLNPFLVAKNENCQLFITTKHLQQNVARYINVHTVILCDHIHKICEWDLQKPFSSSNRFK